METKVQQEIILIVGVLGILAIWKDYFTLVDVIVAGLIGFLAQKNMTDKQSEMIEEAIRKEEGV